MGIVVIVLFGLMSPVSGCSQDVPELKPATISFVYQDYETEFYEPLAAEFMQLHLKITVELT